MNTRDKRCLLTGRAMLGIKKANRVARLLSDAERGSDSPINREKIFRQALERVDELKTLIGDMHIVELSECEVREALEEKSKEEAS